MCSRKERYYPTPQLESFRYHCEFDGRSSSFVQIMDRFPSFFSDATVTNRDRGLDVYSQVD